MSAGPDSLPGKPAGADIRLRSAVVGDAALILELIRELAVYERLGHEVVATEDLLRDSLFGENPAARVLIVECGHEAVAFALYFVNYSTFLGRPGIYLEDLYVRPAMRGRGIGRRVLQFLAELAVSRGYGRLEWSVLDWNDAAIRFYDRIGAVAQDGWTTRRLSGAALARLAGGG